MKILFPVHQFYPMHYTGTEKFLLNLTTTMQRWGHNVKVLACSFYNDDFYDESSGDFLLKNFFYKGIPVLAVRQKHPPHDLNWGIANPSMAGFAEEILRSERPELIHFAHGMRLAEIGRAALRLDIPYMVTLTDFFFMCPNCKLYTSQGTLCSGPRKGEACREFCPEYQHDFVRQRLEVGQEILQGARRVVAPSRFLGTLFKGEFAFLDPKVIPYGIDFSRVKRNKRHKNPDGKFVCIFAGQIDYHKGVHVLIEAVRRLDAPNLELKLYGSGPDEAMKHFHELALGDARIEFCGVYKEDQVGEIFSKADVAIIPSNWHENNTIVMREALASHVPCIVSDAGGMVEKIQDGVNGFVFRMGDVRHLKEVLEKAVRQPELLASMRKNLSAYSLTTVEQEAFAYEQEYQRIMAERATRN